MERQHCCLICLKRDERGLIEDPGSRSRCGPGSGTSLELLTGLVPILQGVPPVQNKLDMYNTSERQESRITNRNRTFQ